MDEEELYYRDVVSGWPGPPEINDGPATGIDFTVVPF